MPSLNVTENRRRAISKIGLALFFSYRRAYHHQETDFGGHLSCIYLDNVVSY